MGRFKWLLAGLLLAVTVPILATVSTLGRLEIDWPDYNDPGGPAQVTGIQDSIAKISNNVNSRIEEYTAQADSTTVTLTHNFGLNFADLSLLFYTGTAGGKASADYAALGYVIIDNVGDPKNKIDITTPGAGGPHDFSVILTWGGGSGAGGGGGGGTTIDLELSETIGDNEMVRLINDGGTAKIGKVSSSGTYTYKPQRWVRQKFDHARISTAQDGKMLMMVDDSLYLLAALEDTLVELDREDDVSAVTGFGTIDESSVCIAWSEPEKRWAMFYEGSGTLKVIIVQLREDGAGDRFRIIGLPIDSSVLVKDYLHTGCLYDEADATFVATFSDQSNNIIGVPFSMTGDTGSFGVQAALLTGFTSTRDVRSHHFPSTSVNMVIAQDDAGENCRARPFTVSSGIITAGTEVALGAGYRCRTMYTAAIPGTEKVVVHSYDKSIDGNIDYWVLQGNGTSAPTAGPVFTSGTSVMTAYPTLITYDETLGKVVTADHFNDGGFSDWVINTLTIGVGDVITSDGQNLPMTSGTSDEGRGTVFQYFPSVKKVLGCKSDTGYLLFCGIAGADQSYFPEDVVGIVKTGGVATDVRTVDLFGGLVDTFTGQTPNTLAYLQKDGSVGTAIDSLGGVSLPVGKFITDTTLLLDTSVDYQRSLVGAYKPDERVVRAAYSLKEGEVVSVYTHATDTLVAGRVTEPSYSTNEGARLTSLVAPLGDAYVNIASTTAFYGSKPIPIPGKDVSVVPMWDSYSGSNHFLVGLGVDEVFGTNDTRHAKLKQTFRSADVLGGVGHGCGVWFENHQLFGVIYESGASVSLSLWDIEKGSANLVESGIAVSSPGGTFNLSKARCVYGPEAEQAVMAFNKDGNISFLSFGIRHSGTGYTTTSAVSTEVSTSTETTIQDLILMKNFGDPEDYMDFYMLQHGTESGGTTASVTKFRSFITPNSTSTEVATLEITGTSLIRGGGFLAQDISRPNNVMSVVPSTGGNDKIFTYFDAQTMAVITTGIHDLGASGFGANGLAYHPVSRNFITSPMGISGGRIFEVSVDPNTNAMTFQQRGSDYVNQTRDYANVGVYPDGTPIFCGPSSGDKMNCWGMPPRAVYRGRHIWGVAKEDAGAGELVTISLIQTGKDIDYPDYYWPLKSTQGFVDEVGKIRPYPGTFEDGYIQIGTMVGRQSVLLQSPKFVDQYKSSNKHKSRGDYTPGPNYPPLY